MQIVDEKLAYKRFISCWHRTVTHPKTNKPIEWDIAGHALDTIFVVVFPFFSQTLKTRLIKEYAQGPHDVLYNLCSGAFDKKKHASVLECAQMELREEYQLKGGDWIKLTDQPISELKWGTNKFEVYLVIDPVEDPEPLPQDAEEYIEQQEPITLTELKELIYKGRLMMPSVQASFMALMHLNKI